MKKKEKIKKTAKQRFKTFLKVVLGIIIVIAVISGGITCANVITGNSNTKFIADSIKTVEYENQLIPTVDADGNYEFVTDRDFRIMHLTDVHLGGGFLSSDKDNMALNAVAAMITAEKPDLVVVTGDVAFPVPYVAGTLNNKRPAVLFADLMEKLGVYWCISYGNHDTEAYSFFSREQISEVYGNHEKYPHCVFRKGPDDIDGCGNYVINIKNTQGKITRSLFMIDSHSYVDNDYFGILWKYDCVHKNQIEWYKNQLYSLTEKNGGETPKSFMFMHIPVMEMRDAYYKLRDNGGKDIEDVKAVGGEMGEIDKVVYSGEKNEGLFDACLKHGSTQAIFFGHDHLNNMTINYKGIDLCYGYSIDYLAYNKINTYGIQRGCSIITVSSDGGYDISKQNYYQDKYKPVREKESVSMEKYYSDTEA